MNKVYRIASNLATNTWASAFETARGRGKGSAGLTLSGIAAAVSLGVPFSRIAQAAPSASYMVAENRAPVLPPGLTGSVSFADESGIATRRVSALILPNDVPSSGDFWRIAGARVVPHEERRVVTREKKRKKRSLTRARKAADGAGAGIGIRIASRGKPATTSRHGDAAVREATRRGDTRYDSTRGAMSAPFYHVARRSDASAVSVDVRGTDSGDQVAAWMAGRPQQYLSAAVTRPDRRTDGVMADRVAGSDVYTSGVAPDSSGGVAATPDSAAPVYSRPWAASGNADDAQMSMVVRSTQPGLSGVDSTVSAGAQVSGASAEDSNASNVSDNVVPDSAAAPVATTPSLTDNANQDPVQTALQSPAKDPITIAPHAAVDDNAKIRRISFTGNKLFSSEVLQEEMQLLPTNWASWYTKNDVYSKERLTEGIEKIRQYYLDRGYLEYRAESVQTSTTPDDAGVSVAIAVHEGERYTLSAVRVVGGPPELAAELDSLNQLDAGEVLSAGKLLASTSAILDRLGRDGYPYATVDPLSQVDPDRHTVDMTLRVDPGRRVTVRRIEVTGNTITRKEVVRREVRQSEHDWFDSKKVAAARDRLDGLGYFSSVDVKTVPVAGSPDQVDVDVSVVEKRGAAVNMGVGYSTSDRAMATAGITQSNVFGSGQSIGANFSTAKPFRALNVTQADPYFTSGGVSRTTRVYFRANEPLYYSSDSRFRVVTQGVDTRFGIPLSDSDKLSAGVAIERNRLDPDALTPQSYVDYVNQYGRRSTSVPITVGWTRDTRDSVAHTTRGYLAQAAVEYGTPVGGNHYYKADINAQYFHGFTRDVVLAMSVQGGYGGGVGNHPYPIYKKYYAGGIGSVRGYEPNSLSPRDVKTSQRIGGSKMLAGSLELKFPVPLLGHDNRQNLFAFVDGGNAWGAQGASIGSNGMRFSYGTGFAWNSPVGALKFSVGLPIARRQFDRYQKFQMQFETVF